MERFRITVNIDLDAADIMSAYKCADSIVDGIKLADNERVGYDVEAWANMTPVRCRSQAHKACTHGKVNPDWREDGSYQHADDSIVCDACYIAIGMPLLPILPHKSAGPLPTGPNDPGFGQG